MLRSIFLAIFICFFNLLSAQESQNKLVYVILDASGSMWGELPEGDLKITAAREALETFVDSLGDVDIALRAYGHNRKGDCADTELVVPATTKSEAASQIKSFAKDVNPKGRTPIGKSLMAALDDIGDRDAEIILISDGLETCGEDPCALMEKWRDKNIQIKIYVVGLGLTDKEKTALQCISDFGGTEFQDAQSGSELVESLSKTAPSARNVSNQLVVGAKKRNGEDVWVYVDVSGEGFNTESGRNDRIFRVPTGKARVKAGIRTINGVPYQPVDTIIDIIDGRNILEIVVQEPPMVKSKFIEKGEEVKGKLVRLTQDGTEKATLRPDEWHYILPGSYLFNVTYNTDNEFAIEETIEEGENKEVLFELANTVHIYINMYSSESDILYKKNMDLLKNGEKVYNVHSRNGAQVIPGVYDVKLQSRLTPFVYEGLEITTDEDQTFDLVVPVGHVTIYYANKDGSLMNARDPRIWIYRKTPEGKYVGDHIFGAGYQIPLMPGSYKIEGWSALGEFDDIYFDIKEGKHHEYFLQNKL